MKNLKKVLNVFFVALLTFSLVACKFSRETISGKGGENNANDTYTDEKGEVKAKTVLSIGNYDGDLGHQWLQDVADEYVKLHPDVKIEINNDKDNYNDSVLIAKNMNYDIYFLNGITYANYVNQDKLLDITEVVNSVPEGDTETILERMNPTLREYYKWTKNGSEQYYAVPFFDAVFGTIYDVDLFEEEGFYYDETGELMCDSGSTTKSAGPNGVAGDYDDGLPATYTEWTKLLNTMKKSSITPYTWTGMYYYYRVRFLASIWADYEGKEQMDVNQSLNGTVTLGDEKVQITRRNGYLLQNQYGKEYALTMAKYIIQNQLYSSDSFYSTNTHTEAQQTFLLSCVHPTQQRIAMILEGGWWENGARAFFNEMAKTYGDKYAYGNRRFAFMPVPKADNGKSASGTTLISSTGNSVVCISKSTAHKELAIDFFKFVNSVKTMRYFTKVTGAIRPYDYDLTEDDRKEMTYFAQNMFDMYHNENTKISYITLFQDDIFISEAAYLGNSNFFFGSNLGGSTEQEPLYAFSQHSDLSVQDYLNGMKAKYSESEWNKQLSKYFD